MYVKLRRNVVWAFKRKEDQDISLQQRHSHSRMHPNTHFLSKNRDYNIKKDKIHILQCTLYLQLAILSGFVGFQVQTVVLLLLRN